MNHAKMITGFTSVNLKYQVNKIRELISLIGFKTPNFDTYPLFNKNQAT
jgi:hypothetical protein